MHHYRYMTTTDTNIDIINFVGNIIYAILWMPQIKRSYVEGADGLSYVTLVLGLIAGSCTETYGIYHNIYSIWTCGIVNLSCYVVLISMKLFDIRKPKTKETETTSMSTCTRESSV